MSFPMDKRSECKGRWDVLNPGHKSESTCPEWVLATKRTNNADMINFAVRHKLIVVTNVLPESVTGT
jgi:hypothetical protein